MANVINRTTLVYLTSVNDPEYLDPPWLFVAPGSPNEAVIAAVPTQYRKIAGDVVSEMSQAEKDAVDAAIDAAELAENRVTSAAVTERDDPLGFEARALIELLNKRDNFNINRLKEIQDTLVAIREQTFGQQARQNIDPGFPLGTATRSRADAIQDYKDEINSGGADS